MWQQGSSYIVGVIHDYGPNSTNVVNTNDTEGSVPFGLAGDEYCMQTSASMIWADKVLEFYALDRALV